MVVFIITFHLFTHRK